MCSLMNFVLVFTMDSLHNDSIIGNDELGHSSRHVCNFASFYSSLQVLMFFWR